MPTTPTYTDTRAFTMRDRITAFVGGGFLIAGAATRTEAQIAIGAVLLLYLFFTRHRQYDLYADMLVIRFLGPRQSRVPLTEVQTVDLVEMPMAGEMVRVERKHGRRIYLMPWNAPGFVRELQARLPSQR